jgi:riboflavin kinase/FMN adenylyltransferase
LKHFTALSEDEIDSIAIGNFDGLHLGHKQLIDRLSHKGALLVIDRGRANLTPGKNRSRYVSFPCFYIKFEEIRDLDCFGFLDFLMDKFPKLDKIIVGYDFKFGANRSCNLIDLKKSFKGKIDVVEEFFIGDVSVHSSTIREFLKTSKITEANALLGREYCVDGDVIKGQGIGKKELVPTLNLDIKKYLLPKSGVYKTKTMIEGKFYPSVTFVGIRESTDGVYSCESHVIDKNVEDIAKTTICFLDFIRENKKFESLEELKKQIKEDIGKALKYFA